jgi:hypothetical protein
MSLPIYFQVQDSSDMIGIFYVNKGIVYNWELEYRNKLICNNPQELKGSVSVLSKTDYSLQV